RVVLDVELLGDVFGDRAAELEQAEIGCVPGLALFERVDGRFPDMPRRDEPGFADPERYDVVHRLDDVEEIADPRTRDAAHVVRDKVAPRRWLTLGHGVVPYHSVEKKPRPVRFHSTTRSGSGVLRADFQPFEFLAAFHEDALFLVGLEHEMRGRRG